MVVRVWGVLSLGVRLGCVVMAENVVEMAARLAQELLAARVDVVRELARATVAEEEARRALEVASRVRATAWAAAVRAGWAEADLGRLKFSPPARRGPGRPRRQRPADPVPAVVSGEGSGGLSAVS
jgi:hypothetical protein